MRNPLDDYRRAQLRVRRGFDLFTSRHCASCPTPCCRRPARVSPVDVMLAEGLGWKAPASLDGGDAVAAAAEQAARAMVGEYEEVANPDCQFLGASGCLFPKDLRPFGCTTYICRPMFDRMDRKLLARMKREIRELERTHAILMTALNIRDEDDPEAFD